MSENAKASSVNRAKLYQLVLFPLNNGATNVYYVLVLSYIATFGSNVLALGTLFASVMVTAMRLCDAITDPIIGALMGLTHGVALTMGVRYILTGDYLPAFAASVTADTVFAFMFDPAYYLWNENMGMTVKRYTDEDTDDEVTKAIEIADGACVDVNSLVTLTKKKA